ncbi:hypothetical protein CKO25_11605 [Thiocapsa imhoffii]|uniref:Uncharacterized protein n=1 Tax=Thiocapsa imhoffii TaxID=382777 RepID=A0A9X1B9G2_9GAMM|nr:hypothetical protein [Thiocapsa imhoffii]
MTGPVSAWQRLCDVAGDPGVAGRTVSVIPHVLKEIAEPFSESETQRLIFQCFLDIEGVIKLQTSARCIDARVHNARFYGVAGCRVRDVQCATRQNRPCARRYGW